MPSFHDLDAMLARFRTAGAEPERHSVVVIDDDVSVRESMAILLGERYKLFLCASAREGVSTVDEDTCAVLLDVKMPEEDGFWACAEIRKSVPGVPIIFYSAYQDLKDPFTVINEYRPFGYVSKGDLKKLLDQLALAVELRASIVSNRRLIKSLEKAESESR
jgi:DNA-binding NtrC family response regulator